MLTLMPIVCGGCQELWKCTLYRAQPVENGHQQIQLNWSRDAESLACSSEHFGQRHTNADKSFAIRCPHLMHFRKAPASIMTLKSFPSTQYGQRITIHQKWSLSGQFRQGKRPDAFRCIGPLVGFLFWGRAADFTQTLAHWCRT